MNSELALKQFLALKNVTPKPMRLAAESWDAPWQTLISTLMSARTRDEVTIIVAKDLFSKYPTIEKLAKAPLHDIQKVIRPVNFYKNKSKHILECAKALVQEHNGVPPHNIELLIKLPGVGRKTANVFLSEQGHDAIGVDVHVFNISRYLHWSYEKDPHKVEEDLKRLFPRRYWKEINTTLVRFGKTHTKKSEWKALLDAIKSLY